MAFIPFFMLHGMDNIEGDCSCHQNILDCSSPISQEVRHYMKIILAQMEAAKLALLLSSSVILEDFTGS